MSNDKTHIDAGGSQSLCGFDFSSVNNHKQRLQSIWWFKRAHKQCRRCLKMLEEDHPGVGIVVLREHEEARERAEKRAKMRKFFKRMDWE